MHSDEIENLAASIKYHNRRYWDDGAPEISDAEYDMLCRRLRELDPENPLLSEIYTPSSAVLSAPGSASGRKVEHASPLLSLDKAYSLDEVEAWAQKYARNSDEVLLIQPKYDGISAIFDGRRLATRGDGWTGDDISGKLPLIRLESGGGETLPDRPARGEIVLRKERFSVLQNILRSASDGGVYKNSRNVLTGFLIAKDKKLLQLEYAMQKSGAFLTLVDYNAFSAEVKLSELRERWEETVAGLQKLPFPLDGIVVKIADSAYYASLGNTGHHPRGAIAFKFQNVCKETKLLGVEWSFGKNCLTPVALLEPVDIGGITIKRATLHNVQNIIDKDIQINDTVLVERAGDVIPYIKEAFPAADRRSAVITHCPGCGSELVQKGPELCCVNAECFETALQRLLEAVRRIGIEQLGEPTLRSMMSKLGVRHLTDIFRLDKSKLLCLDNFAGLKAARLYEEINQARRLEDYKLVAALNIPHVGTAIAKSMLKNHTLAELRQMGKDELSALENVGTERAEAVLQAFAGEKELIDELLGALEIIDSKSTASSAGAEKICFTGKMPLRRSDYAALAAAAGYEAVDDVSSSLSLLVAADVNGTGGKLAKAAKLGIKVISLDEWLKELPDAAKQISGGSASAVSGAETEKDVFGQLELF